MNLIQIAMLYFLVGIACAFSFENIYSRMEMEPPSVGERIMWIFLWPFFVLVFIWGIFFKDDD